MSTLSFCIFILFNLYHAIRRINLLADYVKKSANVYSLGNILPTTTWGKFHATHDHSKELGNPATNKPIIVWIVGHIVTLWFQKDGMPDKQASVSVTSLADSLCVQMLKLLAGLSIPRESTHYLSCLTMQWNLSSICQLPLIYTVPCCERLNGRLQKGAMNLYVFTLTGFHLILCMYPFYIELVLFSVWCPRDIETKEWDGNNVSPRTEEKRPCSPWSEDHTHYQMKDANSDKSWGQCAQLEMLTISLLHQPVSEDNNESGDKSNIHDLWI